MNVKKLVGSKAFYKMVLGITIPIIIQNGITNFVNLLDNIMVGRLGTEQLSGVGIANQLIFVFTLCLFGGLSGAGIFTAQFFGKQDTEGMRYTVRFKLYTALLILAAGGLILIPFGDRLITLFLTEGDATGDVALTLAYGREYLRIALIALIPMSLTQVYANTLRETGQTVPPMVSSIVAVATNALFNYLLIFGVGPFPAFGVVGAALGTVIARVVELLIVVIWSHTHPGRASFVKGLFASLRIPRRLVGQIVVKTLPLMLNEFLWSSGMTVLNQCYSTRGLVAVAAVNIAVTISNVFNIVYMSMGSAVSIIVGNQLGAGQIEEAKDTDRKILAFSCVLCLGIGSVMAVLAPLFTSIYNVTDAVKELAAVLIVVYAAMMPFSSFAHNCYFTLRSGGQTFITFLFDSAFVWGVSVPVGLILSRMTALPIIPLFVICMSLELFKCVIGLFMLKSGKWAKKLV
ncbi:MAG: MATE family efflux transporter [Ruminococcaceae bacterium]|nr:MATE family efflux transporter [Oscillospiraceae bacterium]